MKVLLSIKPEYAEQIFAGTKKYEFRRVVFKNETVKEVIVYASSPVQKVIGEFSIDSVLAESPEMLWKQTSQYAGIEEKDFRAYFVGKKTCYAIKIKKTRRYRTPLDLQEAFDKLPPQSFVYLDETRRHARM